MVNIIIPYMSKQWSPIYKASFENSISNSFKTYTADMKKDNKQGLQDQLTFQDVGC